MRKRLILASQSPRRKELLSIVTRNFEIIPAHVDETILEGMPAEEAVKMLSLRKAAFVAEQVSDAYVIGSDTVVIFGDEIIGKPETRQEARQTLKRLSAREHLVMTGITVIDSVEKICLQEVESTRVKFCEISDSMLDWYLASDEYKDKAGSYAIQGKASLFVDSVYGCYFNVVGFPVSTVIRMFKLLDVELFKF